MQHKLFPAAELKEGQKRAVQIGLSSVLICNVGGEYFAVNNLCSHLKVPLALGHLDGDAIVCRAHGARFSLRTGEMLDGPANEKWRGQSIVNKLAGPVIPTLFSGAIATFPVTEQDGFLVLEK